MPEHLRLEREVPVTERHPRTFRPRFRPADARKFGADLAKKLDSAKTALDQDIGGYDDRRLLKVTLRDGETLPAFQAIPGIEIVSQESRTLVLAFTTDDGLTEFESRLATLATDGRVRRADVIYALEDFGRWTPEDRTGPALRADGIPSQQLSILDVELWPQERLDRRQIMVQHFRAWLEAEGIEMLDTLEQPSLVMAKVRCTSPQLQRLLDHRDVRTVDLPPRFGIEMEMLYVDIADVPPLASPPDGAPGVVVLDTGLATGHPLIGPATGDAQGFVRPERRADDSSGHGTFVSGLALHGDLQSVLAAGRLVPTIRLFSGKVFKDDGTDNTEFVERVVDEAVRYFRSEYGCRVFTLSYGDLNKVYDGRHLRGLAYTLDRLSRALGVLFVAPTGNAHLPEDPRTRYPEYLFEEGNRLLDPGTAVNALTVGGIVRHDFTMTARRYPETIEDTPIARPGQPAPFTRSGPSVNGAVKPDLVAHAGNIAIDRSGQIRTNGLGVLSLNGGFATGRLFAEDAGTSYAAPIVANQAARLLAAIPDASSLLMRALLGAHAKWPAASVELLNPHDTAEGRERLLRTVGYGQVAEEALYQSLERTVTLVAEAEVEADRHHFYEIPLPPGWWDGPRRGREVCVALAYAPDVRTTRLDYMATKVKLSLVDANDLEQVTTAFRRNRDEGMAERSTNRSISQSQRSRGTLQVSRWRFGQRLDTGRLFIVVTRQDSAWSPTSDQPEPYALVVVLDDRERAEGSLYTEVRAMLQARARARVQV